MESALCINCLCIFASSGINFPPDSHNMIFKVNYIDDLNKFQSGKSYQFADNSKYTFKVSRIRYILGYVAANILEVSGCPEYKLNFNEIKGLTFKEVN